MEKACASNETLREWMRQAEVDAGAGQAVWQAQQHIGLSQELRTQSVAPSSSRVIEAGYLLRDSSRG